MSVINLVKQHDRLTLATDGACWDADTGEIMSFAAKAVAVPHWPGVVACRGPAQATTMFAFLLGATFRTFDDVVANVEDRIEDIHDRLSGALGFGGALVDIVLAGWSRARAKGEAYLIRTTQDIIGMSEDAVADAVAAGGILPSSYKLHAFGKRAFGPDVSRERRAAAGLDVDTDNMSERALFDYLRGVMEIQRREQLHDPDDGEHQPFSICGGFAVANVVTANGVSQRVFHEWPGDRVGERIDPGEPLPVESVPQLSRVRLEMARRKAAKMARF